MVIVELNSNKNGKKPIVNETDWQNKLLSYCLLKLIDKRQFIGAVYAEMKDANLPVGIFIAHSKELMLHKQIEPNLLMELKLDNFLKFLSYLNKDICKSRFSTMGCCIIEAHNVDSNEMYHFTLYCRKSAYLSCFFQIDFFEEHL